jgi:phage tail-like protein
MATQRPTPYAQFNFIVEWDGLDGGSVQAGFQEVSGLGLELNVAEYRAGNYGENAPLKVNMGYKVPDVTLKRGVIGYLDLYQWVDAVREGTPNQLKTVTIRLMAEDRTTEAMQWKLLGARPMKYTGPTLNGNGNELAIEELVLAAERIEQA